MNSMVVGHNQPVFASQNIPSPGSPVDLLHASMQLGVSA